MTVTDITRASQPGPPPPPDEPTGAGGPPLIRLSAAARMLRPIRAHLITCAALSAAGAAVGLAPYVAAAEIARAVLAAPGAAGAAAAVWTWVGIGIAGALLRLVLVGLSSHVGHHADAKMLHHLRVRIVQRLGVLPIGWFRAAGSGQVKKAMTGDLEDMHNMFAHSLGEIVGAATAMLVGVGYLVSVDWRMSLVTIAVPVTALICYRVAMRSMPEHTARLIAAERRISVASVEYADGIVVAKTFGAGGGCWSWGRCRWWPTSATRSSSSPWARSCSAWACRWARSRWSTCSAGSTSAAS